MTVNFGGWDHHAKIWEGLESKLPDFDRGFSALVEDVHARGSLDDTLVLAMGEFGRMPQINKDAGRSDIKLTSATGVPLPVRQTLPAAAVEPGQATAPVR